MSNNKIIFLDRDGILNIDTGYPCIWNDVTPNPKAINPLRIGIELGFNYIIVSNQSGIGRGYFEMHDYKMFMADLYAWYKKHGIIFIDDFFCPHHYSSESKLLSYDCFCRKPKSGLIEQAIQKYGINRHKSFLIGDKGSDIVAAENAKLKSATKVSSHITEVETFAFELYQAIKVFDTY